MIQQMPEHDTHRIMIERFVLGRFLPHIGRQLPQFVDKISSLANIAVEDDYADWLLSRRGAVSREADLEF